MRDLITVGCVALVLSLSLAAPVAAGPFEDGLAAYKRGDYATALRLLRPLANQGNAVAQRMLGVMYDLGQGVPQDYAEAMKWYLQGAEQGNVRAQTNLGVMYDGGRGVPEDYGEAMKWYRKAADQGDADAQNYLGVMHEHGHGVPPDYVQAYKWYDVAAARYPAAASERRQETVTNRDRVAARMTAAQIAEAQRLAREWKPKPERPE
jgi:hypothetical protein